MAKTEDTKVKLIFEFTINGETKARVMTTAGSIDEAAQIVKMYPGINKPYFAFNTLPNPELSLAGADFTMAPLAKSATAQNRADINTMLADPETYLGYLFWNQ